MSIRILVRGLVVGSAVLCTGCTLLMTVPTRVVGWGGLQLGGEGSWLRGAPSRFNHLSWEPGTGTPECTIRFPDGSFRDPRTIRFDSVVREISLGTRRERSERSDMYEWLEEIDYVQSGERIARVTHVRGKDPVVSLQFPGGGELDLFFSGNRTNDIRINGLGATGPGVKPAIGTKGGKRWLELPVSVDQMKELFGAPTGDQRGRFAT